MRLLNFILIAGLSLPAAALAGEATDKPRLATGKAVVAVKTDKKTVKPAPVATPSPAAVPEKKSEPDEDPSCD
jgi:hypothetical protein